MDVTAKGTKSFFDKTHIFIWDLTLATIQKMMGPSGLGGRDEFGEVIRYIFAETVSTGNYFLVKNPYNIPKPAA